MLTPSREVAQGSGDLDISWYLFGQIGLVPNRLMLASMRFGLGSTNFDIDQSWLKPANLADAWRSMADNGPHLVDIGDPGATWSQSAVDPGARFVADPGPC